jgi:integrase
MAQQVNRSNSLNVRTLRAVGTRRGPSRYSETVGAYLVQWVGGKQALRPSTRLAYEIHIRRYLVPALGSLQLTDLRPEHIHAMYAPIAISDLQTDSGITAATVHRIHATLMSALNSAVRRGYLVNNPAALVDLPRAITPRMRVWNASEFAAFLAATATDRLQPLFQLMGLTGLRRGEALGLRWVDTDLAAGIIHVEQQIVTVGARQVYGPPKTDRGRRTIALSAALVTALSSHQSLSNLLCKAVGVG